MHRSTSTHWSSATSRSYLLILLSRARFASLYSHNICSALIQHALMFLFGFGSKRTLSIRLFYAFFSCDRWVQVTFSSVIRTKPSLLFSVLFSMYNSSCSPYLLARSLLPSISCDHVSFCHTPHSPSSFRPLTLPGYPPRTAAPPPGTVASSSHLVYHASHTSLFRTSRLATLSPYALFARPYYALRLCGVPAYHYSVGLNLGVGLDHTFRLDGLAC